MENSKSQFKIIKFKTIPSTSQKAKELSLEGTKPWTIIWSEEQERGYGREKRSWYSPKGGLYFSIILPNPVRNNISNGAKSQLEDLQTLTILAAFIIAKIIKEKFNLEPFIKLPNDVFVKGEKIAGILTENVVGKDVKLSVMGIGLNTNIEEFPKDLQNTATSLELELGKKVDNEKILKQIAGDLKKQLATISQ